MNILYHHRTQGTGVEKVHIMGIVDAWRSLGHDVDIISPPGVTLTDSVPEKESPVRKSKWKFVTKYFPKIGFEIFELLYNLWAIFAISKNLINRKYDLIFERYSFLCFAGCLVAKLFNVPFFLEVNYSSLTPIFRKRSFLVKPLEKWIESRVFKNANGIIVVSTYLKELLVNNDGIPEDKIIVLPNAADPDKFDPYINVEKLKKSLDIEGKKVVGFVGYFYPWHGVELFVETYKDVKSYIDGIVYLLVGDGPLFKSIQEKVQEMGLEKEVLLVGRVSHEKVPEYVASFDIAVMPHSNNYGSPMKILEYMAMAKPVIAPRLGPIEDIMKDGKNGFLFEPESKEGLTKQLIRLLEDSNLLKDMSHGNREKIINVNNWKKNASLIMEMYSTFLKRKSLR